MYDYSLSNYQRQRPEETNHNGKDRPTMYTLITHSGDLLARHDGMARGYVHGVRGTGLRRPKT